MTNDTNTLNGALAELGETMADNLNTMGVSASASDGLTTLANKILNITPGPTPTPASISLTADKSILSYEDSQSATLSATVLDADSQPVEGATVEFFKGGTSMGTVDTNSSGVATKTYASTGAGDISFTAGIGSLVSETYTVHDKWYYTTTIPARSSEGIGGAYYKEIFNSAIDLPSAFEIEMTMQTGTSGDRMVTLIIGENSSNFYYNGSNNTNLMSAISRNNTRAVLGQEQNVIPTNTDIIVKIGYNNGVHTVKYNNTTLTVTNSEYTPSKLLGLLITKNNSSVSKIAVNKL